MNTVKTISGVLVKNDDEVLLCQRSPTQSLPNVWSIPCGHVKKGESPINGAIREFYEETNLECDDLKLVGVMNRYKGKKTNSLVYVYLMDSDEKIIPNLELAQDGHEHTRCKYFKSDNLPIRDSDDQLYKIIKKVLS